MSILKWQQYPGSGYEWVAKEFKTSNGEIYLVEIRKSLCGDVVIKVHNDDSFSVTSNWLICFDDYTFSEFNQAIAEAKLKIRESKRGLAA